LQYSEHMFVRVINMGDTEQRMETQVPGFIAEGTGLGCMRVEKDEGGENYALLHVGSGMGLVDTWYGPFARSRAVAERWMENVVTIPIIDWNQPYQEVAREMAVALPDDFIEQCLFKAEEQVERERNER
jgi:hypothetical protein